MSKKSKVYSYLLYLPPSIRLLTELTTWLWLLLAGIFLCYGFGLLLALSVFSLALLNTPGDKRAKEANNIGLSIPGWLRICVELLSASLGIIGVYYYGGFINAEWILLSVQLAITLLYIILDFKRYLWLLGLKENAPKYVTILHKPKKTETI